jgi:hypothetical protein
MFFLLCLPMVDNGIFNLTKVFVSVYIIASCVMYAVFYF